MVDRPPLRLVVSKAVLPVVELHLRKIVQERYKFTRRGKSSKLTVDDVQAGGTRKESCTSSNPISV